MIVVHVVSALWRYRQRRWTRIRVCRCQLKTTQTFVSIRKERTELIQSLDYQTKISHSPNVKEWTLWLQQLLSVRRRNYHGRRLLVVADDVLNVELW